MKKLLTSSLAQTEIIAVAVKILKRGGVIVFPTETAYGIGADFFNPQAVKRVYKIKNRLYNKPLPILVSSFKMAKDIVSFNKVSALLAKKYWPGPLTLVLQVTRKQDTNNYQLSTTNYQTLGLRISSNKLATLIVRKLGRPITATSANRAGQKTCYTADEVIKQFINKKNQPDLVIDAGRLPQRKTSTVVKIVDNKIDILRKGSVKL